jgi:hypothetical protein
MTNLSTGSLVTETIWDNQIQGNVEHLLSRVEPTLTNKSGGSLSAGAVVITDSGNDSAFTTTTTQADELILGVVMETIANDATGRVAVQGAVTTNVQGNVARGDFLQTSGTAGRAETAGSSRNAGTFAVALTAYSGGGAGTVTAMVLSSSSSSSAGVGSATWGGNLIKNFPSLEAADGAQPEWWETSGGGVTSLHEEDATGAVIEQKYERVLELITSAGGSTNYAYLRLTYADEWVLDVSTTNITAGVWVYTGTAGTTTLELEDSTSGSLGTDTTTATSTWTFLSVKNVTLGSGTYVDFKIYHSAAATVFFTYPTVHVGATPRQWEPRRLRYVHKLSVSVLNENPADTNWADVDFSGVTSGNTTALDLHFRISASTVARTGHVRINGSSEAADNSTAEVILAVASGTSYSRSTFVLCDDGQIIEESVSNADVTSWQISMRGYWEWE